MRGFSRLICVFVALLTVGTVAGVSATFNYAKSPAATITSEQGVEVNGFVYVPEEMPDEEVTVLQRLSDILNSKYKTDKVEDSLSYLLDETIQVYWNNDKTQDPFVGSMDNTYQDEIQNLFGDVLNDSSVSFILKNQDLNGDGFNEIALYSTSDTLNNSGSQYEGVVCVYVTVFTPIIHVVDGKQQVVGYTPVCESLRGYCYEIYYSPNYRVPSFSTDEWRESVAYTDWRNRTYELPESAQLNYNSYNLRYNGYTTKPYGSNLSTVLADVL